ncbi:MAG: response regulator transcription factor [Acidimicrobiales bacterium]
MIRLVLADDQPLIRAGLRLVLDSETDLEIVAEASDGAQAVAAARAHRPDLVLMDVRMPGTDGLMATRELQALDDPVNVLILTTFDDDDVLWGAVHAGAGGFVLKDSPADDLVKAIRLTAAGGSWLDPRVTPRLLMRLRDTSPADAGARELARLSDRELEVLRLMAAGATNPEIAEQLIVSERTVKSHVGAIFTKLGARDRAAAIVLAFRAGLVS